MADTLHSAASHDLPAFITAPGETDVLMVVTALILMGAVVAFGVLFLRLHSLPERLAHKGHKIQFEIVAVLCLISLFTHMHIFWIIGLLLALIDIPDFGYALTRIAGSVERMAGSKQGEGTAGALEEDPGVKPRRDTVTTPDSARQADGSTPRKPEIVRSNQKELDHA